MGPFQQSGWSVFRHASEKIWVSQLRDDEIHNIIKKMMFPNHQPVYNWIISNYGYYLPFLGLANYGDGYGIISGQTTSVTRNSPVLLG